MKLAVLSLVFGYAFAFTAPQSAFSTSSTPRTQLSMSEASAEAPVEAAVETPEPVEETYKCMSKEEILASPNTIEFGGFWDPLKLSEIGSDETIAWFRHAEVKHGRVAMAAFVGWWAVGAGLRFPGELAYGLEFSSISSKGLEAWDAVPGWGKAQLLLFAGLIEFHDELFFTRRGMHYMRGGTPGKNMVPGLYDPFNIFGTMSEEKKARGRSVEIKNGRLAMIGVAGLFFASVIPGSVPLQPPC